MKVTVQSLDAEVRGALRHQLIHALSASFVVLIVFTLLVLIGGASLTSFKLRGDSGLFIGLSILPIFIGATVLFAAVFFIGASILAVELIAAILRLFPSRLVALLTLICFPLIALILSVTVLGSGLIGLGILPDKSATPSTAAEDAVMCWLLFCVTYLACEWSVEAWWKLRTSREVFRAARGWRPRGFRLLVRFGAHLGLPVFLANFGRGRKRLIALYFLIAVLNTPLATLPLFPLLIYRMGTESDILQLVVPLGLLLILNLAGVGRILARRTETIATRLYQDVRVWDERAPVIFLRTFTQDDDLLAGGTRDPLLRLAAGVAEARTLDEILLEHATAYGPVLAIGDPAQKIPPLGAARIFVKGEGWQETVMALTEASRAVVMCPGRSAGVGWELELISTRGKIPQTIFLANPELERAEIIAIFATVAGTALELNAAQVPVGMFFDPARGCRVLTAKILSVPAYAIALNLALQTLFGPEGFSATGLEASVSTC